MLSALRAPDSEFRKGGLMLVNRQKHVDKIRIKIYCCVWLKPATFCLLVTFTWCDYTNTTQKLAMSVEHSP